MRPIDFSLVSDDNYVILGPFWRRWGFGLLIIRRQRRMGNKHLSNISFPVLKQFSKLKYFLFIYFIVIIVIVIVIVIIIIISIYLYSFAERTF